jgi:hypothetical protein
MRSVLKDGNLYGGIGTKFTQKMKAEAADGTKARMTAIQFDFSCGLPN